QRDATIWLSLRTHPAVPACRKGRPTHPLTFLLPRTATHARSCGRRALTCSAVTRRLLSPSAWVACSCSPCAQGRQLYYWIDSRLSCCSARSHGNTSPCCSVLPRRIESSSRIQASNTATI